MSLFSHYAPFFLLVEVTILTLRHLSLYSSESLFLHQAPFSLLFGITILTLGTFLSTSQNHFSYIRHLSLYSSDSLFFH